MADILDACLQGLLQLFTWKAFALQLAGIAIGFMVGILPGIGGPVTLALMLPFIFPMSPVEAFSFLLGMAAVTATTGNITSILFGVPGEAITASILVDGYPMAKKGEAGRALGAALMSSFVGAIFGALCLAICIPAVRPLVLSVGSPQYFMLTMLGVAFLASLTGEFLPRGSSQLASGCCSPWWGSTPFPGPNDTPSELSISGTASAWCPRRLECSRSLRSSAWRLPARASPSRMSGKSAVSFKA